jgi:hypothetical protein
VYIPRPSAAGKAGNVSRENERLVAQKKLNEKNNVSKNNCNILSLLL